MPDHDVPCLELRHKPREHMHGDQIGEIEERKEPQPQDRQNPLFEHSFRGLGSQLLGNHYCRISGDPDNEYVDDCHKENRVPDHSSFQQLGVHDLGSGGRRVLSCVRPRSHAIIGASKFTCSRYRNSSVFNDGV